MKINRKDLVDGEDIYLFIGGMIKNGSGDGNLGYSTDKESAMKFTGEKRIFKVTLEEIPLEYVIEERVVIDRVLKPIEEQY